MWIDEACKDFGFTPEQAESLRDDWKHETSRGETRLGYMDWLKHKIATARDNLPSLVMRSLEVLERHRHTIANDRLIDDLREASALVAPALTAGRE